MKFDIVRAWKDENYRQNLSDEQMNTLPVNPAGELELASSELEAVNGGFGPGGFIATRENFHSLAFDCRETVFSITTNAGANFLSPVTTFCINNERGGIGGIGGGI